MTGLLLGNEIVNALLPIVILIFKQNFESEMKIFTHRIYTHRKIILIFLFAIFLPLLIVGYLSLSTFSKRRETVKKLLESNLWFSGEAALKSVEGALLEHEQKALKSENFIRWIQSKNADLPDISSLFFSEDTVGQLFLLNADFKIVSPETASENFIEIPFEKEIQNSQFSRELSFLNSLKKIIPKLLNYIKSVLHTLIQINTVRLVLKV